jgi:two-component system, NarL family, response regulator LiaR
VSTNFLGDRKDLLTQRRNGAAPLRRRVRKTPIRTGAVVESFDTHLVKRQTLIHTLIYGLCGGALIVVLKLVEFRFLVVEHSIEIYGGLIAALFAAIGIWLGLKLTKKTEVVIVKEVPVPATEPFALNEERLRLLGITKRELEILELIAQGMSNREIADKLFVSENTVKTHSSRLFDKLSARRRTQAVQIGKEMGLIP